MSFASNITDLVTSLITALNARSTTGPSDYQMWLAQGNTGTLADYRTAALGGDVDYASQFNAQLGTAPTAGIASEIQSGVTQFATVTDVTNAVSNRSVSPARLQGWTRQVFQCNDLATLSTWAQTAPEGSLAALGAFTLDSGSGATHRFSLWQVANGARAIPVSRIQLQGGAGGTTSANFMSTAVSAQTYLALYGGATEAFDSNGTILRWTTGSAWKTTQNLRTNLTFTSGTNYASAAAGQNRCTVDPYDRVAVRFAQVRSTGSVTSGDTIATIQSGYAPIAATYLMGGVYNGSAWTGWSVLRIETTGAITVQYASGAGNVIVGSISYDRTDVL